MNITAGDLRGWLEAHKFPPDDVNAVLGNKTTPLMKAARQGNLPVMMALLRRGARMEMRNADGNNALWLACVSDNLIAVSLMIEAGIDVNNRNGNGATCVMYAASTGKAAVLARLLAAGADPHCRTLDGLAALDMCANEDCKAMLRAAVCAA